MKTAALNKPINGYRNIELIEKAGYKWKVRLCGNGKEVEVYEDDFIFD